MNFRKYPGIAVILLVLGLAGCTQQNPQDLKEKTAQATAEVKRDARAVAEGIREGWSRDKPLDLNSASKEQLVTLPGMTEAQADRVIGGRPYSDPHELLSRGILRKAEYQKIADRVVAKK
jgi:radical SAM superfamily enzyme with C-terminal helix-hairpin-helix motif